jgi:hypothetical protein
LFVDFNAHACPRERKCRRQAANACARNLCCLDHRLPSK